MIDTLNDADRGILRAIPLFRMLPEALVAKILASGSVETVPARRIIFEQGQQARMFYMLLDGWLKLSRRLNNGAEAVIGLFTRGEVLAEAVALTGQAYPALGETVTPVRLLALPAETVRRIIEKKPDAALAMIASTAQHLQVLTREIAQLKARRTPERVVEFLLSLTEQRAGPARIQLPIDKNLIAARLGMQPESLSRALALLRRQGIEVHGAEVTIEDVARLVELLDSVPD